MPANPFHSVEHYENFPVGSWLVPARLRPAVGAIYRFARYADDVADEGDAGECERLDELDRLAAALTAAENGQPVVHPVVAGVVPTIVAHRLPWDRFHALLSAFRQDVTTRRYPSLEQLVDYCRRSADPVGHLMLTLFGCDDALARGDADAICSGLQRINFLQDLAIDWRRGRLYLPLDQLAAAGLADHDVGRAVELGRADPRLRSVIRAEAEASAALLRAGLGLTARVPVRLAWELRAIVAGGSRILHQLAGSGYDPLLRRPRLSAADLLPLAWRTLRPEYGP